MNHNWQKNENRIVDWRVRESAIEWGRTFFPRYMEKKFRVKNKIFDSVALSIVYGDNRTRRKKQKAEGNILPYSENK